MNRLSKILISLLILNFVFSAGPREDRKSLTITNKNIFYDITGWCNVGGVWQSKKFNINCEKEYDIFKTIETSHIKSYEISEYPNLIMLEVGGINNWFYIIEKKELRKKMNFKQKGYGYIEFDAIDNIYLKDRELPNIESKVWESLNGKAKDLQGQPKGEHLKENLLIIYYRYDDVIQYFLASADVKKTFIIIEGLETNQMNLDDITIKETLETQYFESSFKEFKSFFIKSASQ